MAKPLEKYTLKELQIKAKDRKIAYSGLNKADLIKRLRRKNTSMLSKGGKCPSGMIRRRSYVTSAGKKIKAICYPSGRRIAKVPVVLPTPRPDKGLARFGYKSTDPAPRRRAALARGVKKVGYSTIIRRLNLIRNLTHRTNPVFSRKLSYDIKWMQKTLK